MITHTDRQTHMHTAIHTQTRIETHVKPLHVIGKESETW